MKRCLTIVFTTALAAVFAGGCAMGEAVKKEETPKVGADPRIPAECEAEALAAAEKVALGMAEAIKTGDFKKFEAVQPKHGRGMPKKAFEHRRAALNNYFGKLVGVEYFGKLDQGQVIDYLWKYTFEDADPAPRRHEAIFWVRVGSAGGKPMVAGFSFDLH